MNEETLLERSQQGESIRVRLNAEGRAQIGGNPGLAGWIVRGRSADSGASVKWDGQRTVSRIHVAYLEEVTLHGLTPPGARYSRDRTALEQSHDR